MAAQCRLYRDMIGMAINIVMHTGQTNDDESARDSTTFRHED